MSAPALPDQGTTPLALPAVVLVRTAGQRRSLFAEVAAALGARGWYVSASRSQVWYLARGGAPAVVCDLSRSSGAWGEDQMLLERVRARHEEEPTAFGEHMELVAISGGMAKRPYTGTLGHERIDTGALATMIAEHLTRPPPVPHPRQTTTAGGRRRTRACRSR